MARRTKEDAEKTREALLDAAERVFLLRGVTSATLNEIAKEAGLTRGAVYWHFEDKFAIFKAMCERVKLPIDALYEQLTSGPDPVTGLKKLCIQVWQQMGSDEHSRNVFSIMRLRCEGLNCEDSPYAEDVCQKRQQALGRFEKVFTHAAKHKQLAKGITPEIAALSLHSYLSGIIWDYLYDPAEYPVVKLAKTLMDSFFRSILRA